MHAIAIASATDSRTPAALDLVEELPRTEKRLRFARRFLGPKAGLNLASGRLVLSRHVGLPPAAISIVFPLYTCPTPALLPSPLLFRTDPSLSLLSGKAVRPARR